MNSLGGTAALLLSPAGAPVAEGRTQANAYSTTVQGNGTSPTVTFTVPPNPARAGVYIKAFPTNTASIYVKPLIQATLGYPADGTIDGYPAAGRCFLFAGDFLIIQFVGSILIATTDTALQTFTLYDE